MAHRNYLVVRWTRSRGHRSVLRDDRVPARAAPCADGRPRRDRGRSPSGARVTHADWGRGHLQRDARGIDRAHQKGLLRSERWVRVHPCTWCRSVKFCVHRPRISFTRCAARKSLQWHILGHRCVVGRCPWRSIFTHSATHDISAANDVRRHRLIAQPDHPVRRRSFQGPPSA